MWGCVRWYDRARLGEVRSDRDLSKVTAGQRPAPLRCQSTLLFCGGRRSLMQTGWTHGLNVLMPFFYTHLFTPQTTSCVHWCKFLCIFDLAGPQQIYKHLIKTYLQAVRPLCVLSFKGSRLQRALSNTQGHSAVEKTACAVVSEWAGVVSLVWHTPQNWPEDIIWMTVTCIDECKVWF